jgi:DNA-binding Xre family transcriptional regulator
MVSTLVLMTAKDDDKTRQLLAANLKRFMLERGFDATELAQLSGVKYGTIQKYQRTGAQRGIGSTTVAKLAMGLQCDPGQFYKEKPDPLPPWRPVAFTLNTIADDVDDDLMKRATAVVESLNREYSASKKKSGSGGPIVKPAGAHGMTSVRAHAAGKGKKVSH